MPDYNCEYCEKPFKRRGKQIARFCSIGCKASWQREQKPVTKEWLYQKYVVEGLGTYQIARLVDRDPKRVYEWIKDYNIPIRSRDWSVDIQELPQQNKEWLYSEYVTRERSALDIANELGVTEANILYFLKKHAIKRRAMTEIRAKKKWGLSGSKNGMFGKRGDEVPNWKGGCTPERQAFYSSQEWATASKLIWKRDNATCQKCGVHAKDSPIHIHHIVSFSVKELRAEPKNLILLCVKCHRWVHSKGNINRDFIGELPE